MGKLCEYAAKNPLRIPKTSMNETLTRTFQLAFSLRSISLGGEGTLPPSRKRSLFTLATSMLVLSSKAFNIPPLIPIVKTSLNEKTVDPFLHFVEDCKLKVANTATDQPVNIYGSKEDDVEALKSLSGIELTNSQTKEPLVSLIMNHLRDLLESDLSTIRNQLLNDFLPDDLCPTGEQLKEAPVQVENANKDNVPREEVAQPFFTLDDDVSAEVFESSADAKPEFPTDIFSLLSVNQLLETNCPNPFLVDLNYNGYQQTQPACNTAFCMTGYQPQPQPQFVRLPASNPFDDFLCAAHY